MGIQSPVLALSRELKYGAVEIQESGSQEGWGPFVFALGGGFAREEARGGQHGGLLASCPASPHPTGFYLGPTSLCWAGRRPERGYTVALSMASA